MAPCLLLLGLLVSLAPPSDAAPNGAVLVPPTRAGCGLVHLPVATTLGISTALDSARRGWRVIYVAQAVVAEPIDALGVRAEGLGVTPDEGGISVLGYDPRARFPIGDYRVCVFSDLPSVVTIPAPGLRSRIGVNVRRVRARGVYPDSTKDSSLLVNDQTFSVPLTTTARSLVVLAGAYRYGQAGGIRSSDAAICFAPRGRACHDESTFGVSSPGPSLGPSSDAEFTYYATIDVRPGDFTATYHFRGNEKPTAAASFMFQAEL